MISDDESSDEDSEPEKRTAKSKKKTKPKKPTKPQTKVLESTNDPNFVDCEEVDDTRDSGCHTLPLLLQISKPCHRSHPPYDKRVRCIGSAGCHKSWAFPRNKGRVLTHAAGCGFIAQLGLSGRELVADVLLETAKRDPTLLVHASDVIKKRGRADTVSETQVKGTHIAKRTKGTTLRIDHKNITATASANVMDGFKTEGRRTLDQDGNKALVELIAGGGLPPRLISLPAFARFLVAVKAKYQLPSRSKFEENLLPTQAAVVQVATLQHLQACHNLNISFDGGKLTRRKFYSVHVTTAERLSFCLELDDVSRLSQTGNYIHELLRKVSLSTRFLKSY